MYVRIYTYVYIYIYYLYVYVCVSLGFGNRKVWGSCAWRSSSASRIAESTFVQDLHVSFFCSTLFSFTIHILFVQDVHVTKRISPRIYRIAVYC